MLMTHGQCLCSRKGRGRGDCTGQREDTARDLGGYHDCGSVEAMG